LSRAGFHDFAARRPVLYGVPPSSGGAPLPPVRPGGI